MNTAHFNFQRFCWVFKRDVVENWGKSLRTYIGVFLGYFILLLIFNVNSIFFAHDPMPKERLTAIFTLPILLVTGFYVLLGLSGMFSNLSHKQSRINFFMLPASNLEKYLVRFVRSSLMFWLVMIVCFVLADLSAWVAHHLMGCDTTLWITHLDAFGAGTDAVYESVLNEKNPIPLYTTPIVLLGRVMSYCAWMGTYVLGAAIFRKQPFILTSLVVFCVSSLSGFVNYAIVKNVGFLAYKESGFAMLYGHATLIFYLMLGIHTVWSIFCFWITYRMFKNANVVVQRTIGL